MIENSIIIPVFGNEKLVHNLLETLQQTIDQQCEIIIVDDGHADMKINPAALPPDVIYLSNERNLGYSAAVNYGIDVAKGKYITTINSDILVDQNWLLETRRSFRDIAGIGMLGAKLVYPTTDRVMHAGIFFGNDFAFNGFRMSHSLDTLVNEIIEVQGLCDALATMPKEAIMRVGKYDETYFTSVEDLEMCFRFSQVGLKNIYNPNIIGYHKTAASKDHRYKTASKDEKLFLEKWKLQIKDDTLQIFEKSMKRGIKTRNALPAEAYIININRKNTKATLDSFLEHSKIKVIGVYDYTYYIENTPRYEQKSIIDLLDVLPFSHLNLRYPIIYLVDFFVSLAENNYWQKNRCNQNDLVFDYAFNLYYLKDILNIK